MTNEKTVRSTRVTRKPLAQRGPQTISGEKDPNYVYRFVNDTGSRIEVFKQAGYELVTTDELTVGDARVMDSTDLGSSKRVVSNDGTTSYLMRIKKEWYDEDQKAKADLLAEQEKAMTKEASSGMYGTLKVSNSP
jgi:hypothetical protein